MRKWIFINANINKNNKGFFFIDIIVGFSIFTITVYYLFLIVINEFSLLQNIIEKSKTSNNNYAIAKYLSFGTFFDFTDVGSLYKDTIRLKNYTSETRPIRFIMKDNTTVSFDMIIVKNNTIDTNEEAWYMLKET